MRSPRRLTLTSATLAAQNLSTDPPPQDSLFWTMWNACTGIAQGALQTPFVQRIKAGTLDPVAYGAFNVSDAYYCFHGLDDYAAAAKRATNPTLKAFLEAKHKTYEKYNTTFPTTWRVRDGASIVPYDITRQYSDFETRVAAQEDPIYSLIVILPCEYLWAWLAAQLAPPAPQNLYASWVTSNEGAHGAFAIGNFLETYRVTNPGSIDPQKALRIYTQAMTFEQQNFAAATPPPAA
jgi:thiaminase/transcriptional activator TenA